MPTTLIGFLFGRTRPRPRSRPVTAPGAAKPWPTPKRPRDQQRQKVYRWEAEQVMPKAADRLDLDACRDLVGRVFHAAEWPQSKAPGWAPPRVTDGRGRRHAAGSREVIKLPRWSRTLAVVLHECAHGLARDGHGPDFVARYVELLEAYAGLDRDALLKGLAVARIRCSPLAPRRDGG